MSRFGLGRIVNLAARALPLPKCRPIGVGDSPGIDPCRFAEKQRDRAFEARLKAGWFV